MMMKVTALMLPELPQAQARSRRRMRAWLPARRWLFSKCWARMAAVKSPMESPRSMKPLLAKAQFNIRVLNLSLAVSGSSNGRDAFSQACNRAVANGIVTVVAAGNDGSSARTIGAPSAAANVITVGAGADPGERGFYLADFSSRGPTADGRIKPDLWAPGVRLRSPQRGGGYSDVSGTSFASPFVAGVAALMINARPSIKPGGVKSILLATAERWAPGAKNSDFGAGRLQAYQAVARAAAIQQDLNPPDVPRVRFIRTPSIRGKNKLCRSS